MPSVFFSKLFDLSAYGRKLCSSDLAIYLDKLSVEDSVVYCSQLRKECVDLKLGKKIIIKNLKIYFRNSRENILLFLTHHTRFKSSCEPPHTKGSRNQFYTDRPTQVPTISVVSCWYTNQVRTKPEQAADIQIR